MGLALRRRWFQGYGSGWAFLVGCTGKTAQLLCVKVPRLAAWKQCDEHSWRDIRELGTNVRDEAGGRRVLPNASRHLLRVAGIILHEGEVVPDAEALLEELR